MAWPAWLVFYGPEHNIMKSLKKQWSEFKELWVHGSVSPIYGTGIVETQNLYIIRYVST